MPVARTVPSRLPSMPPRAGPRLNSAGCRPCGRRQREQRSGRRIGQRHRRGRRGHRFRRRRHNVQAPLTRGSPMPAPLTPASPTRWPTRWPIPGCPMAPPRPRPVSSRSTMTTSCAPAPYPYESTLTVANVGQATFGKLFARAVDDQTYAQPLWMAGVAIPGHGVHNTLYVATMSDSVYAFDADDPSQGLPLWKTSFLDMDAGIVPASRGDVGLSCGVFSNISGNIGIESTPVIDAVAGRMFVVAKTKNQSGVQTYTLPCAGRRDGPRSGEPRRHPGLGARHGCRFPGHHDPVRSVGRESARVAAAGKRQRVLLLRKLLRERQLPRMDRAYRRRDTRASRRVHCNAERDWRRDLDVGARPVCRRRTATSTLSRRAGTWT